MLEILGHRGRLAGRFGPAPVDRRNRSRHDRAEAAFAERLQREIEEHTAKLREGEGLLAAICVQPRPTGSSLSIGGETVQSINAAALRIFGYEAEEIVGADAAGLIPVLIPAGTSRNLVEASP